MAFTVRTVWRVIRSYSIEEKVLSLVVAGVVLVLLFQSVADVFKRPELFGGEGGYYTEGLVNDQPTILNPVYADLAEANRDISSLIFSGLTRYDPKVQAFVKDLADLSISQDGTTYTFTLRDGVTWHDGEPLTATDVVFTFHDVIQSPDFQNPVLRANFEGVKVKQIDERTVEFLLSKPNSFFITNLNVGILPEHILGGVPVAELPQSSFNAQPVGTGPYKVEGVMEVLQDGRQRVLLALNENFYGEKPKIKNIRFHVYPDAESMRKEVGTLNVIAKTPGPALDAVRDGGRFEFLSYELPQYTAVFLNMDSPALKKDKVRIALQKAINKEELLKVVPNKTGVDTPLMELDQSEWLYQPNVDEARGALFDSGYKMEEAPADESSTGAAPDDGSSESDGGAPADLYRKDADGNSLKLVLLVRRLDANPQAAEELQKTVDFLVESWKAVGASIDAQFEPMDVFGQRVRSRDYDLVLTGESLGYNLDTYSYWHSTQAGENGLNLSNYKSFAADALIERIRGTFDAEEKIELLQDLAQAIATDVPAIFLYRPSYIFSTDGKVKGVSLEHWAYPSDRFADIAKWCIVCE